MDRADVCRTSSRASRRPPDVISAVAILNPRWRRRKWRHPGPGVLFWIPIAVRGAKWRPFRFRSPSWMTSENEVIQDGDRKRKGRHFAPRTAMGIKKSTLYYFQINPFWLGIYSHLFEFWMDCHFQVILPLLEGVWLHQKLFCLTWRHPYSITKVPTIHCNSLICFGECFLSFMYSSLHP